MLENISLDCGWGKLILGKTFSSLEKVATELKKEKKKERNICFNANDSQVLIHKYSQDFFLNPAYTYVLDIENFSLRRSQRKSFSLRFIESETDIEQLNEVYTKLGIQNIRSNWWPEKKPDGVFVCVAVDEKTKKIIGGVMGVDHFMVAKDEKKGASLWSLAVDLESNISGVGKSLVKYVIQEFKKKKRKNLFLSVIHSNIPAQKLYESLGFIKTDILSVKKKSPINREYFISQEFIKNFSPSIQGLIKEAIMRGIQVDNMYASFFRLSFGGRNIMCNNTLTDLTNAIVASYCANQKIFFHLLAEENISFPKTIFTAQFKKGVEFLKEEKSIILKSQFHKLSSDEIKTVASLKKNGSKISAPAEEVILQKYIPGTAYRMLILDDKVLAVMKTSPPSIIGDGKSSLRKLIKKLSRKKFTLSDGLSKIPLDSSTRSTVLKYGYGFDDILPKGESIFVRKNSNFTTGGDMIDLTDSFPQYFCTIAKRISKKLQISLLDIEMIIPDIEKEEYYVLGGNPKPNFLYYRGHNVNSRFLDFLFPQTKKLKS